jgi:hypothetical protein
MVKDTGTRSRGEIGEKLDRTSEKLREKESDLDRIASDIETVRQTIVNLALEGTDEGKREVERAMDRAEDVTEKVFEHEDQELDRVQGESDEYRSDLEGRAESIGTDAEKIADTQNTIQTKEAEAEFEGARASVLEDLAFLKDVADRAKEMCRESDDAQKVHQERARTGR